MYAVILAGGEGTRLWPLSRPDRPKPFLPLLGPTSLLQRTVGRIEPLVPIRDVHVVTDRRFVGLVREQLPELPPENVLGEPIGRNTAAAIALAAAAIDRPGDEPMLVLPADHQVRDEAAFREALVAAASACRDGFLVTLGITPSGPETGYGYVLARSEGGSEAGVALADGAPADGMPADAESRAGLRALVVERFVEKPDATGARALLATGAASWNSGIFVWTRRAIRDALVRHAPDVVRPIEEALAMAKVPAGPAWDTALERAYPSLRARSIDYAVMEAASLEGRVRVIRIDVGWSDLGSWSSLRDAWIAEDERAGVDAAAAGTAAGAGAAGGGAIAGGGATGSGHVTGSGNRRDIDSRDCLVVAGDRLVVTIGLSDTIVVDTPDALLVCAADRAQDVRRIANELAAAAADAEHRTEGNR